MNLLLIDTSIYLHKSIYVAEYGGDPVSTFWDHVSLLKRITGSEHTIYCLDHPSPTFRHKMYANYKAHRPAKTEEFKAFKDYIEDEIKRKCMHEVQEGFESDDLIASMATQYKFKVSIGSSDLDLSQLVNKKVTQFKFTKSKFDPEFPTNPAYEIINRNYVINRFGVLPNQVATWKALAGDVSDGYKLPIRGLGDVAATKLLLVYKTLEGIYESLDDEEFILPKFREPLRTHKEEAFFFRELATVRRDIKCIALSKI